MDDPEREREAHPLPGVEFWEHVIEDMAATAAQYRDDGREAIELHPGDVTLLTGEPRTMPNRPASTSPKPGDRLDVVVPGDEFRRVADALEDRTVERSEVFRATDDGMVFLLVARNVATTSPCSCRYTRPDRARGPLAGRADHGRLAYPTV